MQLKTADHKYSNVLEPILNPEDAIISPNDHVVIPIQSQIYAENAVTGILQPSDLLHEEGDITFCAALVTLHEGAMRIRVNNSTIQPYKLKKGMHIANFSVMTPEQMKYVRPIDPVSTWHFLNENEEDAIYYISSLLKANRNSDQYEQYWFPTSENPGDETTHTPIQQRILKESRNLQNLEQLNPHHDAESIEMLAFNFASWTFVYKRLAQGLSRALSAFSTFKREYLDRVIKADQCAQYVDDIGVAATYANQLITNLRATFQCIREAGLKLSMHKCHFGATEIDFLGRKITPEGVKPQRERITNF